MRTHHRRTTFLLFTLLLLGCGKKPDSEANSTPEQNPTTGKQPPAGSPGIEGTYLIVGYEFFGDKGPADTTFISEPPPKPKPPPVSDEDGPVVAELTKKGFLAEKQPYGKFSGVDVTVPPELPLEAIKELNGHPRIRTATEEGAEELKKLRPKLSINVIK